MTVWQTQLTWSAAGGAGGTTVLHHSGFATPQDIADTLGAFAAAVRPAISSSTTLALPATARRYDAVTGALEAEESIPTSGGGPGSGGSGAVPNAAQGLIRLRTAAIVGGRFLQGRIYIPGLPESAIDANGEVSITATTALTAAGATLIGEFGAVVWHRPVGGAGGSTSPVISASVWREFAVQRRRRA